MIVLSAIPGSGKTFASKIDDTGRIYDIDGIDVDGSIISEEDKATIFKFPKDVRMQHRIEKIKELKNSDKIILVEFSTLMRLMLHENNIDYYIIIPDKDEWESYKDRFHKRGNSKTFINVVEKHFKNYDFKELRLEHEKEDQFIILPKGKFLYELIKERFM